MALADYNLEFELPFKDHHENSWKVEIWDRDGVSVSPERLKGTGTPVKINYQGSETFEKGIIGSSCEINVFGTPNTDGTSDLSLFFTSDEERFYVKVLYDRGTGSGFEVYWVGFLYQDEYIENIAADPYQVSLMALDRLGSLEATFTDAGYNIDDTPTLLEVVQALVDETKLEFPILENVQIETENGDVDNFLVDQEVSIQTYIDGGKDEFVKTIPIRDAVDDMAKAMFCQVYQSSGNLVFSVVSQTIGSPSSLTIPSLLTPINNDLQARHLSPARVTNISYKTQARNLLPNPSFETDAVGTATPTGWAKVSTSVNSSIITSDTAVENGSNKSLLMTAERVSEATFEDSSLADKTGLYNLLEAETLIDIDVVKNTLILFPSTPVAYDLQGIFAFSTFIDNTYRDVFTVRYSIARYNEVSGTEYFYNFNTGAFESSFSYSYIYFESTGNWEKTELPFLIDSSTFGTSATSHPIIVRMHTPNYHTSLSDVRFFFDNFRVNIYNASGSTQEVFLPDSEYFNSVTNANETSKTGSIDISLISGTTALNIIQNSVAIDNQSWQILNSKVLSQFVNKNTGNLEKVRNGGSITTYEGLPELLKSRRINFDNQAKKVYSTTLQTPKTALGETFRLTTIAYGSWQDRTNGTNISSAGGDTPYVTELAFTIAVGYTFPALASYRFNPATNVGLDPLILPVVASGYSIRIKSDNMGNALNPTNTITATMHKVSDDSSVGAVSINGAITESTQSTSFVGGYAFYIVISGFSKGTTLPDSFYLEDIEIFPNSDWRPLNFSDYLSIDFPSVYTDSTLKAITRFGVDPKHNVYNIDAINLP